MVRVMSPAKRSPHQKGADEDRQHRAGQGPHKARNIPCREQGGKPYKPAGQKQPTGRRFHHQRRDEGRSRGEDTKDHHYNPGDQKKDPMASNGGSDIAPKVIMVCCRHPHLLE
jgi:hypothetical protein